jgi:hypothetical protein
VSRQVLHVDFATLSDTTTAQARSDLIRAAGELTSLESVAGAGLIEANAARDYDLAFFFLLPDLPLLERFGTDERYSRFLQGNLAPLLRAFAGADVQLAGDFPAVGAYAACLALSAPAETYDWEIAAALAEWSKDAGGAGVTGLAAGERQRYRGLAMVFDRAPIEATRPAEGRFAPTLLAGRARPLP